MANYNYTGTVPSGGPTFAYPGNSGLVLCSVGPVPVGTGGGQNSTQRNGVWLGYGQTKERHVNTDDVLVLYLGRAKPAVETSGIVAFDVFTLAYTWPTAATALDGSAAIEAALNAIQADCRNGYMVQLQTSQGHGATFNGFTYPSLLGRLQDVAYTYPTDRPGWTTFAATFTETGSS